VSAQADGTPQDPYLQMMEAPDPYPLLHELREQDPVHFVAPLGFWFVTRYDDVKRLFNDPDNCTGDRRAWAAYVPPEEGTWLRWIADNSLFALPPEDHARIRRLVSVAFTPAAVRRMDLQIREVVDQFAQPLKNRNGEVIDLLGEFTNSIPNVVISRITGVPPGDDEDRFREMAQSVIASFLPFTPPDVVERAEKDLLELSSYVRALCAERREHPREDLISDLVHASENDEKLSEDDVVSLVTGLVAAGSETTALGGMALISTLLQNPDALEALRADRSLIPKSINEIMRFTFGGPAGLPRYALRDFELRGKKIQKGQMLLLAFGGANRDPEVYENPDLLDIHRDVKDLLTFGQGPHYCLGANLARQEMGCMIDALLDILPRGSMVVQEAMEFTDAGLFKRPVNLPVQVPAA
jgi:cytochrome P450